MDKVTDYIMEIPDGMNDDQCNTIETYYRNTATWRDSEILERMNQLYMEYALYWNEYARRKKRDGERGSKAQSPDSFSCHFI